MKKMLFVSLVAMLLGACTSIPLKTMYKLSRVDGMSVDPGILRVALRYPNTLKETKKGAVMVLKSEGGSEKKLNVEIQLEKQLDNGSLKKYAKEGYELAIYKIADKDVKRVNAFRNTLKAQKAKKIKLKSSMSIISSYCRMGELSKKPLLVSNWLKVDNSSGFLPTVSDYDLRKELDKKNIDELLPLCSKPEKGKEKHVGVLLSS